MSDKICFNKTLTYLVLLVAAVVGAFYVMNYANSQNLGSTPKAAPGKCNWASVSNYPAGCGLTSGTSRGYSTAMNSKFVEDSSRKEPSTGTLKFRCCVAIPESQSGLQPSDSQKKAQIEACAARKGEIVVKKADPQNNANNRCTYYDGGYQLRQGYVFCTVKMSDDFQQCAAAVGTKINSDTRTTLAAICAAKVDKMVPGTQYTSPDNQNRTCLIYTGGYRYGNVNVTPAPAGTDQIGCLRVNAHDLYKSGKYETDYCK
ncbi:hypothetical protein HZA76_03020 [Candidatus Roizmanbacteria bacterium]|nr:hypothetical protein [Candidatus Roizmanbacteria bacterium]